MLTRTSALSVNRQTLYKQAFILSIAMGVVRIGFKSFGPLKGYCQTFSYQERDRFSTENLLTVYRFALQTQGML